MPTLQYAFEALGWTVVHSVWQGTILAGLLALFLSLHRGRQPQMRYLASVTTLVAWFVLTIGTFIWMWPATPLAADGAILPPPAAWPSGAGLGGSPQWWMVVADVLEANAVWIGMAWVVGCLLVGARWMGGQWYLNRIRRDYSRPATAAWANRMNQMARSIGLHRTIELLESSKVHAPMLVGALKPAILVPLGLLGGMDPRQIDAVLAHELAHLRRWDDVVNVLLAVWESLWFYHPAYWWIAGRVREERELCCDDMAVKLCGDPLMYARTLADLEARRGPVPAAALAMQGNEGPLFQRIQRIMMPDTTSSYTWPRFLPAGLAIIAFLIIGWVSPTTMESRPADTSTLLGPITVGSGGQSLIPQFSGEETAWASARGSILPEPGDEVTAEPANDESATILMSRLDYQPWSSLLVCLDSPTPKPPMPPMPAMPEMPAMPTMPAMPEMPAIPAMPAMPAMPDMSDMPQAPAEWTEESRAEYERAMEAWGERFGQQMERTFTPEWEASMEAWGKKMEAWGEEFGKSWGESDEFQEWEQKMEAWGEQYGEAWENSEEFQQWQEDMEQWAEEWEEAVESEDGDQGRLLRERERQLEMMAREHQRMQEMRQRNVERVMRAQEQQLARQQQILERATEEQLRRQEEIVRRQEGAMRSREEALRQQERVMREMEARRRAEMDQVRSRQEMAFAEREDILARARDINSEDFWYRLFENLVDDGIVRDNTSKLKIRIEGEELKINGTKLEGNLYRKYRALLSSRGIGFCEDCEVSLTREL